MTLKINAALLLVIFFTDLESILTCHRVAQSSCTFLHNVAGQRSADVMAYILTALPDAVITKVIKSPVLLYDEGLHTLHRAASAGEHEEVLFCLLNY